MTTSYGPLAVWAVIVAIGVVTYAIRFSFIALFGRTDAVPPRVGRALRFVPPAVLAALVFPALIDAQPTVTGTLADDRLIAGTLAAVVAWRTENVLATIGAGMVALWTLRFLL
ncbi:AzlD domain-containing protein [Halegenticoccus soli]|uniref:AzlD domain-containing protein n=1 Tax=Halegenticoccus soli TaxID=1985678 RepID=UPI000C6E481D|nr:AzlD domain-containing protein [Halegenticoccus soli]